MSLTFHHCVIIMKNGYCMFIKNGHWMLSNTSSAFEIIVWWVLCVCMVLLPKFYKINFTGEFFSCHDVLSNGLLQ